MTSLPNSAPDPAAAAEHPVPADGHLTSPLEFEYPGPLGTSLVDYRVGWDLQRDRHAGVAAGERPNTVLLLEHASVYTAGKRTEPHERPLDGTPVVDVDRGGKITWHGPGQLVGYPIVKLPSAVYVVDYVRRLEEAIIDLCAELGLPAAARVQGRSGVWLPAAAGRPERKIAQIGVRVAGGVTMHGFAINADPNLAAFGSIIPCGITDAGVTSIAAELGQSPSVLELAGLVRPHLERYLAFQAYQQSAPLPPRPAVTYGLSAAVA